MKVIVVLALFVVAVNAGAISIVKAVPVVQNVKVSKPLAIIPLVPVIDPKSSGYALPGAGLPLHGAGLPVLGGGLTLKG